MDLPHVEYYNWAWQQVRKESSLYNREKNPALWQEFWDQYAPTYLKISKAQIPKNRELIRFWVKEGLIDKSMRVLDIGCGPGTFTIPLAEAAGQVTGLDTSKRMLAVLSSEAREKKIDNLELINEDWRKLRWKILLQKTTVDKQVHL